MTATNAAVDSTQQPLTGAELARVKADIDDTLSEAKEVLSEIRAILTSLECR